ncbi:MAG: lytic transglycosylase domain-containing protein [Mariprofundaceae bacterium]|nr:lytic transglycosylase domain-containing protein [Mariprofundaceae bacterium]
MTHYLSGASGKGVLAGIMILGFFISLPFLLSSTQEEKQNLVENTETMALVEKSTGSLSDLPKEDVIKLRADLQASKVTPHTPVNFEEQVWEQDIRQLIQRWVPNDEEAGSIARWVYIYSVRFNLSPELLLGLIAVESRFDHFAVSNVGARGLMQVMPFWKKELGQPSDNLFEIETNIRYGSAILHHYIKRYRTERRALAAYNGSLGKDKYPNKVFSQMRKFKAIRKQITSS